MHVTNFAPLAALAGLAGLAMAMVIYRYIVAQSSGTDEMRSLAGQIETGAMAFLRREYTVLIPFVIVVAGLLGWAVGYRTGLAYIFGGSCSVLAGLFGMKAATKANVRTTAAAKESGQAKAWR